jgi:hypothetical protein
MFFLRFLVEFLLACATSDILGILFDSDSFATASVVSSIGFFRLWLFHDCICGVVDRNSVRLWLFQDCICGVVDRNSVRLWLFHDCILLSGGFTSVPHRLSLCFMFHCSEEFDGSGRRTSLTWLLYCNLPCVILHSFLFPSFLLAVVVVGQLICMHKTRHVYFWKNLYIPSNMTTLKCKFNCLWYYPVWK